MEGEIQGLAELGGARRKRSGEKRQGMPRSVAWKLVQQRLDLASLAQPAVSRASLGTPEDGGCAWP